MRSKYTPPTHPPSRRRRSQADPFGLAALVVFLFLLFNGVFDSSSQPAAAAAPGPAQPTPENIELPAITWPYASFVLTQGLHGQSYGHLAVDLTAGKGAAILSPISGEVTALYIDDLGNTTLELENERYRVTLLHGLYTLSPGDQVRQSEPIGTESNQGYTVDFQGHLCTGRDCGYHTHLNLFDKQLGSNVSPLEVLPPLP